MTIVQGMLGVLIYSLGSTAATKGKADQATAKGRTLDRAEAERLVTQVLTEPLNP